MKTHTLIRGLAMIGVSSALTAQAPRNSVTEQKTFAIGSAERQTIGFVVSEPGPISAQVVVNGDAVQLELIGPTGVVATKSGNGTQTLSYTATQADIGKALRWGISVRDPRPLRADLGGAPVSQGTMTIVHPVPSEDALARVRAQAGELAAAARAATMPAPVEPPLEHTAMLPPADGDGGGGGTQTTAVAAQIASVSPTSGGPGAHVTLTGAHLDQIGVVRFKTTPTRWVDAAAVVSRSPTSIVVVAPTDYGTSYAGQVKFVTALAGRSSNTMSFQYVPQHREKIMWINLAFERRIASDGLGRQTFWTTNGDGWAISSKQAGDLNGARGDDEYFMQTRLKNGFTVLAYDFVPQRRIVGADAYVAKAPGIGTNDASIRIHWWCDANFMAMTTLPGDPIAYSLRVQIRGPDGPLPYP